MREKIYARSALMSGEAPFTRFAYGGFSRSLLLVAGAALLLLLYLELAR